MASVAVNRSLLIRIYGAPGRTRTHNLLIRSQTLYPIELQGRLHTITAPRGNAVNWRPVPRHVVEWLRHGATHPVREDERRGGHGVPHVGSGPAFGGVPDMPWGHLQPEWLARRPPVDCSPCLRWREH